MMWELIMQTQLPMSESFGTGHLVVLDVLRDDCTPRVHRQPGTWRWSVASWVTCIARQHTWMPPAPMGMTVITNPARQQNAGVYVGARVQLAWLSLQSYAKPLLHGIRQ
jgi:hypothetical protein